MIPKAAITAWAVSRPWPSPQAIEQDLLLARMIVEIYNDPLLADELVFRGGTCIHQVMLATPLRYSEDLDFVRSTNSAIGPLFDALRKLASRIGLHVTGTQLGEQPKIRMTAMSEDDPHIPLRIKIEINTRETSPAQPAITRNFDVDSTWFTATAQVRTFTDAETMSSKIRALYQRKKGRDLFDLWLGLTRLGLTGDQLLTAFDPYRPHGMTAALAVANLQHKLADPTFRRDLAPLIAEPPHDYNIDSAGTLIIKEVLTKL